MNKQQHYCFFAVTTTVCSPRAPLYWGRRSAHFVQKKREMTHQTTFSTWRRLTGMLITTIWPSQTQAACKCGINESDITSALQTGTLRSLLRAEEVSLCHHRLHPQRNWREQAERTQDEKMSQQMQPFIFVASPCFIDDAVVLFM